MHNAAYRTLGLDWHYVPFEVDDVAPALAAMRALDIRGFGISMPFKQVVMPLCDALDPVAAKIGAVNTVVQEEGRLVGHNTDWIGASRALAEALPLPEARVLLLGAGGAARAVAYGLVEAGAQLTISNRGAARGRALADEVGATFVAWSDRGAACDAVVNATSAGMQDVDPSSPFPSASLHEGLVVMDIVYKPLHTALLEEAAAHGARTLHGGRMLLHQAARQHELYTGTPAPLAAMDAALEAAMERLQGPAETAPPG